MASRSPFSLAYLKDAYLESGIILHVLFVITLNLMLTRTVFDFECHWLNIINVHHLLYSANSCVAVITVHFKGLGLSNDTNELMAGNGYSGDGRGITAYYGTTGTAVATNTDGTYIEGGWSGQMRFVCAD